MPKVSEFYGIAIYFYYREHQPPHFHARYSGSEELVTIDSLEVLQGSLPPRAHGLVREWALLHRTELAVAWDQARRMEPISSIQPLR